MFLWMAPWPPHHHEKNYISSSCYVQVSCLDGGWISGSSAGLEMTWGQRWADPLDPWFLGRWPWLLGRWPWLLGRARNGLRNGRCVCTAGKLRLPLGSLCLATQLTTSNVQYP